MSSILDNAGARPLRGHKPSHRDLFDAPDQWRIRGDLRTFFGPNAGTFLDTYEKMRRGTGPRRTWPRTWSWPVFLGSFVWFFYRKMYAYGTMLIFLPLLFSYLFGSAGGATWILFAMGAKGFYVNSAVGRIIKADQLGLIGAERADYLERAGGVSLPAGILAGLIYAFLLALSIVAVIGSRHAGHG
jgi:hypothetical protein